MKLGSFRLGMRTFKNGISCHDYRGNFRPHIDRGNPMIAALSAVFSLEQITWWRVLARLHRLLSFLHQPSQ